MSDLKNEMLKIKVKGYFDNGDLKVDSTITVLVKYHIDKARHNIETGSLLMEASKDIEKIKSAKRLDEKYVNRMWATKSKRNTAQYKADSVIAQKDAERIYKNAIDFVDTIESLIRGLK